MTHNWPQRFAVSVMRRVRPGLEEQHARILKRDPKKLFDQVEIRRRAAAGAMAINVTDPVFLTIVSESGVSRPQEVEPKACAVCLGQEQAMKFWKASGGLGGLTMFEVAKNVHRFTRELAKAEPISRGRG